MTFVVAWTGEWEWYFRGALRVRGRNIPRPGSCTKKAGSWDRKETSRPGQAWEAGSDRVLSLADTENREQAAERSGSKYRRVEHSAGSWACTFCVR